MLSNSKEKYENMSYRFGKAGFRPSFEDVQNGHYLCCYKKICVDNENFYQADENTGICCVGTFIYKEQMGKRALKEFYEDYQKYGIGVREQADGFFAICVHTAREDVLFTDIDGKYGIYYYAEDKEYIVTCNYAHIQEQVHMPVNELAMIEQVVQECVLGEETPIHNIYRLEADRVLYCRADGLESRETLQERFDKKRVLHKEGSTDRLCSAFRSMARGYDKVFEHKTICMTGGLDSRAVLAALLSGGNPVTILSWQGRGRVFNSQKEDRISCEKIAQKCGLPIQYEEFPTDYRVEENSVYYERLGELSFIYGGNLGFQKLFEEKINSDYMTFGCMGEALRANEKLDKVYRTPFTIENYIDEFYLISSYKNIVKNWREYRNYVLKKARNQAVKIGIDVTDMSREDCMLLHHYHKVRCDGDPCKIANVYRYSTLPVMEPAVRLENQRISYREKEDAHLQLSCIDRLKPELMEIPVFSHCRYYPVNREKLRIELDEHQEKVIAAKAKIDELGKKYMPGLYGKLLGIYLKRKFSYSENANTLDTEAMSYYLDYIKTYGENEKMRELASALSENNWDDMAKLIFALVYICRIKEV